MDSQANTALVADTDDETAIIAAQNDQFRKVICGDPAHSGAPKGQVFVTPGVVAEGQDFVLEAIRATGAYTAFSTDADPYGLHEMGVIIIQDKTVWWRIDLYDRDYAYGADAPTDLEQTRRVLTILLPCEY